MVVAVVVAVVAAAEVAVAPDREAAVWEAPRLPDRAATAFAPSAVTRLRIGSASPATNWPAPAVGRRWRGSDGGQEHFHHQVTKTRRMDRAVGSWLTQCLGFFVAWWLP